MFEARTSPHAPSPKRIRAPSMAMTSWDAWNLSRTAATTRNFTSSGQSTRISGVTDVRGTSWSSSPIVLPLAPRISTSRSAP